MPSNVHIFFSCLLLGSIITGEEMESIHSSSLKRVMSLWCECEHNCEESGPPKLKHRIILNLKKEGIVDDIVKNQSVGRRSM